MISNKLGSVICLDLGRIRIGVAGCDALRITISPLPPIIRSKGKDYIQELSEICTSRNASVVIFGLPLDEEGKETYQSKQCKKEAIEIARNLELPYAFVNEHSSTWEARNRFNLNKDKSGKLDSAAAAILLEQWFMEGAHFKATT